MEHLRTSEDERQRVVSFLAGCCAEGYLEVDELDERQSHVLGSRTRGELALLVADMPGAQAVLPGDGCGAVTAPFTFVKPSRRRRPLTPLLLTVLGLMMVMVLAAVPVFELLALGIVAAIVAMIILVVLVTLAPWLAAGALVAWSVNRLRQPPSPPQPH